MYIPDKNFWCRICGINESNEPHHKHHIIPKSIGGTDSDGRIIMCKKCHEIIHNAYPAIIWHYVTNKEEAKEALKRFVKYKVRYNDYPKTINESEIHKG